MCTCNLSKTMHNIWLQQLGKSGACMYTMTFDDYVQAINVVLFVKKGVPLG
jgi:hypothetical protein